MRELTPLDPGLRDPTTIGDQLARDGYLFLPGLIDPTAVLDVRQQALETLSGHGWLAEGTDPADARPSPTPRLFGEDSWWAGYTALLGLERFNQLAHRAEIKAVVGSVVGDDVVVQPMKIARVTWPDSRYPTPPHQDYFFVRGHCDVLTAWIPLGDCPAELGGLRLLVGSHREGLRSVEPAFGAGNIRALVDEHDPRWTAPHDYSAGDVVLFHSLTVHWAPPNNGGRLRVSVDYRYQSARDPLVPAVLRPHECPNGNVPDWGVLTRDWESTEWIEVDHPIRLASYRADPEFVPPSRLLGSSRVS